MVDWRIYYDGGATVDSEGGSPDDAPAYGVVLILHRVPFGDRERNELIVFGDFYYYITGDRWYTSDHYGLREHLRTHTPLEGVCQGRLIPFEDFNTLMGVAKNDPDFPDAVG